MQHGKEEFAQSAVRSHYYISKYEHFLVGRHIAPDVPDFPIIHTVREVFLVEYKLYLPVPVLLFLLVSVGPIDLKCKPTHVGHI